MTRLAPLMKASEWHSLSLHIAALALAASVLALAGPRADATLAAAWQTVAPYVARNSITGALLRIGGAVLFIAPPVTHGVAGKRKYAPAYAFIQPFVGGKIYVALQSVGWTSYGVGMAALVYVLAAYYSLVVAGFVRQAVVAAAVCGVASEICVALSLFCFQASPADATKKCGATIFTRAVRLARSACSLAIVSIMYNTALLLVAMLGLACWATGGDYFFMPLVLMGTLLSGSDTMLALAGAACLLVHSPALLINLTCALLYRLTFIGAPAQTGRMEWVAFKHWSWFWETIALYFNPRIITHGNLSPGVTYMYGWHGHGILPFLSTWIQRTAAFQAVYRGVDWVPLGASIIFRTPILREIGMWAGGRDVSRASFNHALSHGKSVLVVPGGQAEMREHSDDPNALTLISKHKGFVRMAIQHGVALVPVISYHENQTLSNVHMPWVQKLTCGYLGVGLPHLPYGRWYLPIPNLLPEVVVVFGDPIAVSKNANPTDAEVDCLHAAYYQQVAALYDRYKAEAGLPEAKLRVL